MIRLATCKYIDDGRQISLRGTSSNVKTHIIYVLGNAACRKFKSVRCIRMPELLDKLSVSKDCGIFKKAVKKYQPVDFRILDEWLIRYLSPDEVCNHLEIIEDRCTNGSTILCTQFETDGRYRRIKSDPKNDSPISEVIMDRIVHNVYNILIDGKKFMRERHSLAAESGKLV